MGKWWLLGNGWNGYKPLTDDKSVDPDVMARVYDEWVGKKLQEPDAPDMSGYGDEGNCFYDDDSDFWDALEAAGASGKALTRVDSYLRDGRPVRAYTRHTTVFPSGLLVSPQYAASVVEARADEQRLRGIGHGGVTGYQQQAQEHMASLFKDADISVRMKSENIPAMIELGRYRNRAEAEIPRFAFQHPGASDARTREGAEIAVWGQHPVYGYLSTPDEKLDGPMSAYGDAKLVLKRSVRDRTTITWGDSLHGISRQGGTWRSAAMLPSPIDHPSAYSVSPEARDVFDWDSVNPQRKVRSFLVDGYIEAQVLGGVHLSDIDYIRFTKQPPDEVVTALVDAGIPWAVGKNPPIAPPGAPPYEPDNKFLGFGRKPEQFVEQEHPRGEGGRFIDKTIIRKEIPLRATRAWKTAIRRPTFVGETSYHGDSFMYDLAEDLGFTGKPTVVQEAELNQQVNEGSIELWRGVTDRGYADKFLSGPYYAGTGFRANGIYVAYGPEAYKIAHGYATTVSGRGVLIDKHEQPVVMHMALKKQAKVAEYEEIAREAKAEAIRLNKIVNDKSVSERDRTVAEIEMRIANDPGKYAMALGFDAMRIDDDEYTIFNRTALLVSEEFQNGRKP